MDELRNWSKNLETKMVPTDPNGMQNCLSESLPLFGYNFSSCHLDLCLFVPCFPAFFDLLISLGQ